MVSGSNTPELSLCHTFHRLRSGTHFSRHSYNFHSWMRSQLRSKCQKCNDAIEIALIVLLLPSHKFLSTGLTITDGAAHLETYYLHPAHLYIHIASCCARVMTLKADKHRDTCFETEAAPLTGGDYFHTAWTLDRCHFPPFLLTIAPQLPLVTMAAFEGAPTVNQISGGFFFCFLFFCGADCPPPLPHVSQDATRSAAPLSCSQM